MGNQAALRRVPLRLQRQTTDDPTQKAPDPKPLIPLGKDWKFDPSGSHPDAPKPWDKPGGDSDGTGGSLEDIHKGWVTLFGPKAGPPALNKNFQTPPCGALQSATSTTAQPKNNSFANYDTDRKVFHSPLTKDPWPPLTPEQYQTAVYDCKASAPKPTAPTTAPPATPAPGAPTQDVPSALPKRSGHRLRTAYLARPPERRSSPEA